MSISDSLLLKMFPNDFQQQTVAVNGINLCVTTGGQGPALILLHGVPQTHHHLAPRGAGAALYANLHIS